MNKELIKGLLERKFDSITLYTSICEEVIKAKEKIRVSDSYVAFMDNSIEKYIDICDIRKVEIRLSRNNEDIDKFLSENKW